MSAYIDSTYLQNALGATKYDALIGSSSAVGTQLIEAASAMVNAALKQGGYTQPLGDTVDDLVKLATLGAMAPMLYGIHGLDVREQFRLHIGILNKIAEGKMPLPTLTPSARDAVGGVKFSKQGTTSTDRPAVFGNGKMRGVW